MKTQRKIINNYKDEDLLSIKYVVSISCEEDLNQFWDFITNSKNLSHKLLHTFITQFYNFAITYVTYKKTNFFEIILEESEEFIYFTLWNEKIALLFKKYLKKTPLNYIYKNNRLTIKLDKSKYQDKINKRAIKNQKREDNLIKSISKSEIKKPYTFLDSDDLNELLKLSEDMQELIFIAKKDGLNSDTFISLRSIISLFCLTLRYYDKIAPISKTITEFSNLINQNKDNFIKLEKPELELINGFILNIDYWLQTLFVNGGADIYFMDNSIKADYDMIFQLICPSNYEEDENSLDDIFDF